jgi:hypothetical protein
MCALQQLVSLIGGCVAAWTRGVARGAAGMKATVRKGHEGGGHSTQACVLTEQGGTQSCAQTGALACMHACQRPVHLHRSATARTHVLLMCGHKDGVITSDTAITLPHTLMHAVCALCMRPGVTHKRSCERRPCVHSCSNSSRVHPCLIRPLRGFALLVCCCVQSASTDCHQHKLRCLDAAVAAAVAAVFSSCVCCCHSHRCVWPMLAWG